MKEVKPKASIWLEDEGLFIHRMKTMFQPWCKSSGGTLWLGSAILPGEDPLLTPQHSSCEIREAASGLMNSGTASCPITPNFPCWPLFSEHRCVQVSSYAESLQKSILLSWKLVTPAKIWPRKCALYGRILIIVPGGIYLHGLQKLATEPCSG